MSLHSELGWNSTVCAFDDSLSPSEAAIWYTCLCALPPADAAYLTAGLEGWSHEVVVVGETSRSQPQLFWVETAADITSWLGLH